MGDSIGRRTGQPPVFWITIVAAVLGLGFVVVQIALAGDGGGGFAAGLIGALVLAAVLVGGSALGIRRRMRDLASAFPAAVDVPITVGAELAAASARVAKALGDDGIRMRASTYAALGFDGHGVHVATSQDRGFGLIPADRLSIVGYGRSLLGAREMTSLILRVSTDDGDVDFAFVPMRLKGNPVRQLTPEEFDSLSSELSKSITGAHTAPGWPY